jgi:hypothetical protein
MRRYWNVLLVFGSFLILTCTCIFPSIETVRAHDDARSGQTWYVGGSGPGNYSSIQVAVNMANNGDAVFVYDDSSPYHEQVVIGKSIMLLGENKDTTVIDGGGVYGRNILIAASGVTIRGFTLQNTRYLMFWSGSIWLEWGHLSNVVITDNIITHHPDGVGISNYLIKQQAGDGVFDIVSQERNL